MLRCGIRFAVLQLKNPYNEEACEARLSIPSLVLRMKLRHYKVVAAICLL
jgi:hypothetical protein